MESHASGRALIVAVRLIPPHHGRLFDAGETPVSVAFREQVDLLHCPSSVAVAQIDQVPLGVTVADGKFVEHGDRGVLDHVPELDGPRENGGTASSSSTVIVACSTTSRSWMALARTAARSSQLPLVRWRKVGPK